MPIRFENSAPILRVRQVVSMRYYVDVLGFRSGTRLEPFSSILTNSALFPKPHR